MQSLMPEQESPPLGGSVQNTRSELSELSSFGEELRREREIRGISLKEIADSTKISKRFLEAIERNDHLALPAPAFARGFVREYARYVGLNAEEMVNRYNFAVAADDRIEKPPEIEKYPQTPVRDIAPRPPRKTGIPSPFARINRSFFAMLFIVAALAAVAWWAVQQRQLEPEAEVPVVPVTTSAVAPPLLPDPVPATDDSSLRLTVEMLANSWITLEADGKTVVNSELEAGDRRSFEAAEVFRFRTIGNAAGVKLTLNGMPVERLGADGDVVRNRDFDLETVRQMRAASAAAASSQP